MTRTTRFPKRLLKLAVGAALLLAACHEPEPLAPPAESGVFEELRGQVEALEGRLGPDAYTSAEMEVLIKALESFPADSPSRIKAQQYARELGAKRRVGLEAIGEAKLPPPVWRSEQPPSYGPRRMEGLPPGDSDEALARIERLAVGASRSELLEAYGSCLVRQTWFKGTNGGPTTELFHVAPDCRKKLKPRVYTVASDRVTRISEGALDGIMEDPASDELPLPHESRDAPPPPRPSRAPEGGRAP